MLIGLPGFMVRTVRPADPSTTTYNAIGFLCSKDLAATKRIFVNSSTAILISMELLPRNGLYLFKRKLTISRYQPIGL